MVEEKSSEVKRFVLDLIEEKSYIITMLNKTKGQQAQVAKPEPLALSFSFGPVTQRIEWSATNRLVAGLSPARPSTSFGLVDSANYQRGHILKPKPKDRVSKPTVIFALALGKTQGQNDMPQLQNRNGESWLLWKGKDPALQMQAMRKTSF
jgi:hypothetical protein